MSNRDPEPGTMWMHYKHGMPYTVLFLTNTSVAREGHPVDVVYQGENGALWSRPLSDWHRSFKPL